MSAISGASSTISQTMMMRASAGVDDAGCGRRVVRVCCRRDASTAALSNWNLLLEGNGHAFGVIVSRLAAIGRWRAPRWKIGAHTPTNASKNAHLLLLSVESTPPAERQ
jgi:hypothetical protein